jgi:GTP-binding protein HflX
MQKRPKPDPAFFIGKGKVQELALFVQQENIDLCIFDDELSPAQQRNIEQAMGIRVLDRTALILDIFAQRARTNEGKLQVELAQLQYNLPRIMGKGLSLSRLGGGIGTRGPGETKLEVDRRRIRDRIAYIKECIGKVKSVRTLHRVSRNKASVPTVSLVGYTNAGKSTLLNTLTNSDIYAKDQLFATLDPTTRQLDLPNKQQAILTDTVGFIQRLPHQLVAAFQSTLEEVVEADVLLHVIDVSHELYKEQSNAVYHVLEQIGAKDKTIITVYNKIDKLPEDSALPARLAQEENSICISAKRGLNLDKLLELIAENLKLKSVEEYFLIPYSDSAAAARMHSVGTVLEQEYLAEGTKLKVRLDANQLSEFEKYLSKGE